MATTWIVSANASRARIFSQANAAAPLEEVDDMINEAARMRESELTESDRVGPTSASKSMHNTGGPLPNKQYEPKQTIEEQSVDRFARDIAAYLGKERQQNRFDQLCLVASPKLLGLLRNFLDPAVQGSIKMELDKDYTQLAGQELLDHINAQKA